MLDSIDADQWDLPTPCPEWSVLSLCTHLVGDDFSTLARQRDRSFGTAPPPDLDPDEFPVWLDDLQEEWVRAARRMSPRLVVDLLAWTGPQVVELMAEQDPSARTAEVTWAGSDPVPVWLDQARELSERWIHRQQLLTALGRPDDLDPGLLGPILDAFRWAYPYRLTSSIADAGDAVSITIAGSAPAEWHLVAAEGGRHWDFASAPGARVIATLTMTTEQAWRLLTNNMAPSEQDDLDVTGDPRVTEVLLRTRAIIGTPNRPDPTHD